MLVQQLFNGLLLGATFCLAALGFNLVVGAMDRLNFSLGETAMVSAIVSSVLLNRLEMPFFVAFLASLVIGGLLSVLVYFVSFKYVSRDYPNASILSSLGVGIVLTALVIKIFGSEQQVIPDVYPGTRWDLGPIDVTASQLVILVLSAALTVGLYVFLERSRWGTAIRGVSDDVTMSGLLGVPVERVVILTFALSGMLAGAAGLLTGLAFHAVSPLDGFATTLSALIIIVIGGLGSVKGAVVAAIAVGMVETLSVVYLSATMRDIVVYIVVAAFLLFRPQGLFGRNAGVLERV
ncbi:branched-chain amino acid ABC transporter permease [Nakamurella leprariae]|uniref:Branched-chain amino acid ABC transporter permease n=1 Tax=Nakamurella leprariae TaxID=2803911 RepID=A0A938YA81_9ACTN|nr:branched-chain amino acid ABC transporter permease [Nakamurella leprariae]MBM9468750.1 branched-chain amino acid ABC transporter permease [Nakamurella leprariae]